MRNQCCESCRPSRWTNSRPRRQKSVILERLGRRGSILSTYSFFYTSLYVICTISARRCTSHRRLWLAVRDLQGEQTRNRRSRRRCDFAVPDRTPASGCAEGSSQLVYKSFNRHRYYWLVSAMISIRSIPYECPTFACQIFFFFFNTVKLYPEPCRSLASPKSTTVKGFPSISLRPNNTFDIFYSFQRFFAKNPVRLILKGRYLLTYTCDVLWIIFHFVPIFYNCHAINKWSKSNL